VSENIVPYFGFHPSGVEVIQQAIYRHQVEARLKVQATTSPELNLKLPPPPIASRRGLIVDIIV
tara:strand:- start:382 stop:573 length:192 start_codon:yes stop_codon:yes gene_type:complete